MTTVIRFYGKYIDFKDVLAKNITKYQNFIIFLHYKLDILS